MTSKLGKGLLVAAAVLVALLLVVVIGAPLLVSGDAVRTRVQGEIAAATGAEVSLGKARVTVFPRLALRLGTSRIAGTGAGLRAARGDDFGVLSYAAEFDVVEAKIALLPLLGRRLTVGELRFAGPQLQVMREGQETVVRAFDLTVRDFETGLVEPAPPDAPPGVRIPADLRLGAELRAGEMTVQGATYTDIAATARMQDRVLRIKDVVAGRSSGRLSGEATLDWSADPWGELSFAYRADAVPAGALLEPLVPDLAVRLEAPLSAVGRGTCSLRDGETALATLKLAGSAEAGGGILHAADWLADVSSYLGDRQDLKDIRFRGLDHAYRIEDGRYLVESLVIDGKDTAWQGEGWVGLDGTIDLGLHVKLPAGFTPDLGAWSFLADLLRDDAGRVQLDLRLTGRTARPAVSVDLSRLKDAAAEQNAETLRKGVGSLLDKWRTK